MDYHQFIAEASRISSGEPLDKTIRLRADLDGSIEVVCGYFSPDRRQSLRQWNYCIRKFLFFFTKNKKGIKNTLIKNWGENNEP